MFYRRILKRIRTKHFYRAFVKRGSLVFDIGANVGTRTNIFLSLGARVIAVEPQKSCVAIMRKKFSSHENLTVVQKAVSNQEGKAEIYTGNTSEISTLSPEFIGLFQHQANVSWNGTEQVELTTLSQLIAEFGVPAHIKIDVEGYEKKVLETFKVPVRSLSFEYITPQKKEARACLSMLNSVGDYQYNFMMYEDMRLHHHTWLSYSDFDYFLQTLSDDVLTGEVFCMLA
jgi:FkbM family methyltransferase